MNPVRRLAMILAVVTPLAAGCAVTSGHGALAPSARGTTTPTATSPTASAAQTQVTAAARALLNTTDRNLACDRLLTTHLLTEIYRDAATCRARFDTDQSSTVTVGAVTVRGTTGQARFSTVSHGRTIAGTVTFVEQAGVWRADAFGDDYIRTSLQAAVSQPLTAGVFSLPEMRSCMVKAIPTASITMLRSFLYASLRKDPRVRTYAVAFVAICPVPVSKFVAHSLMRAVKTAGRTPAQLRCIETTMADILPVTGLAPKALDASAAIDSSVKAALAGVVSGAEKSCT